MFEKRNIALTMVSLILIVLTTACNGSGGTKEETKGTNNAPESSGDSSGYPIVKDKMTFKIFAAKDPLAKKTYNEMKLFKDMEAKTNVHIDWTESINVAEQKNLLLASGDLPDAFISSLNGDEAFMYGQQKLLIPLEDLIAKHAPNIQSFLDKRPEVKQAATSPDGHIYGIPKVIEVDAMKTSEKLFINKTWLDKLKLKVPTNAEEYYQVLKAFKEQDPNGNGKADEIPLTFMFGSNWSWDGRSLFGLFGMIDPDIHILVFDNKVTFTANKPEHKAALEWLHKLYAEKLIDQEIITQNLNQMTAKGQASEPVLGSFFGHNGFRIVTESREKEHYIPLPPMTNINGKKLWNGTPYATISKSAFNITSKAKNPEILLRWADTHWDPKTSTELYFGPFGLNLQENAGGGYSMLPTPEGTSYPEFRGKEGPGGVGTGSILKEEFAKFDNTPIEKTYYNPLYEVFKPAIQEETFYPPVYYTTEQLKRLGILKSDINEYVKKMQAEFVVNGGINEKWDSYVSQLDRMGLNDMLKIYQDAYNAYKSSNKP